MRGLALLSVLLALLPEAGRAGVDEAFASFKGKFHSPAFAGASLSPRKDLILKSAVIYNIDGPGRAKWVGEALAAWSKALEKEGVKRDPLLASVVWPIGGEIWKWKDGKAVRIEEWSDERLSYNPAAQKRGSYFGSLGLQSSSGGALASMGFNVRAGTMLLNDRYDTALTYSYFSMGEGKAKTSFSTIGVVGRMLFPLSKNIGWNLGAQFLLTMPEVGDSVNAFAAVAGLNFYLPAGSVDLSGSVGKDKRYTLSFGYTFYLSAR